MKIPYTLSLYIGRQFLLSIVIVFSVFFVLIVVVDTVEILRRSYSKDIPFFTILEMSLLKFPLMGQKLAPFIILVGAVMAFSKLTKTHELIVARSAGVSAWQFLSPAIAIAFVIGIIMATIINPIGCAMISKFEQIEAKYLKEQISSLSVSSSGLWLRQRNNSDNLGFEKGDSIIHAIRAGEDEGELYDVIIFVYTDQDKFVKRIDAKRAKLENDFWHLKDVIITEPNKSAQNLNEYFLETELTLDEINNSLAPPETISFWELPSFIKTLKEAGFSSVRHQLHFHSILVSPFFYMAMVIIASLFSMRPPRRGASGLLISGSIVTGFLIYFLTDLVSALGLSGGVPVILAAWVPVAITAFTGITLLLHMEDG
jgi:lipopolysaccharide export system permease protein